MNTSTRNLLFLLAAAPMGFGGCVTPSDDSDTNNNDEVGDGDGDPGDGDGDPGDGDGDPGDGDGDPGDGDGDPGDGDGDPGDGDGDPGDGDGDPGDGDGDPGDGDGDPGTEFCQDYAQLFGECYGARYIDSAVMYCESEFSYYSDISAECGAAYEAAIVCLTALTCEEFEMAPPPCLEESDAVETICGEG